MKKVLKIALAAFGLLTGTLAAAADEIAYVSRSPANSDKAYLVTWLGDHRAEVVNPEGKARGLVVAQGSGVRQVTFDAPITSTLTAYDSCGEPAQVRRDVNQVTFRRLDGTPKLGFSTVTELGVQAWLDGCDGGKTEAFGSSDDAGETFAHRAMSLRPSMDDVVPGVKLAGALEHADTGTSNALPRDVVEILAGSRLQFQATGTVVPYARSVGRWHVLSFAGFQRAYTRLSMDPVTGGETWMSAEWVGGAPAKVHGALVVKVQPGAAFGTVEQAARLWKHAWYELPWTGMTSLYPDGRGLREIRQNDEVTTYVNFMWRFEGLNLLQEASRPGAYLRQRTWQPVAVNGKYRFVMESEWIDFLNGNGPQSLVPSRLVFFEDLGAAVPPATSVKRPKATRVENQRAVGRRAQML